ncbi:MAG: TolC family protein [Chitinophagales bacterium]|nr:TolC family protein [Bacteroidota bacterium]MCB9042444.1 TolC family protein [Chitinophagales bacterium]
MKQLFNKLVLVATTFCMFGNIVSAQNVMSFSLEEAQNYAEKHHLTLENSALNIEKAKGQVNEIKSIGLPQVNASLQYIYNLKLPAQLIPSDAFSFPPLLPLANGDTLYLAQSSGESSEEFTKLTFGTKNSLGISLEASQLLFDGSYLLGLKAANLFVAQAKQQNKLDVYQVRNAIAEAYTTTLLARESITLLDNNINLLQKIFTETQAYYQEGFIEQLEVDRLELSLTNLKTRKQSALRAAALSEAALKFQMGLPVSQAIELTDNLEGLSSETAALVATDVNVFQEEAQKNRLELQLLKTQNEFRDLDIRQIKAKYLPNVAAFFQANSNFQDDGFHVFNGQYWIPSSLVGLRVSVPIFDGNQKKAQIQQRKILQTQAFNQENLFKQSVALEVTQSYTQFVSAYENWQTQVKSMKLAQKIYDVSVEKYRTGVGSSLEVTDAESKLFETQSLYIQSLYELSAAQISLEKATGN